ncbi:hypothetical protein [Micromonospora ureilytica]|uniref:hypothetical protein n=1 Tax=Micromonospora ureilytica TaxID=709868 RepID=UPI004039FE18
MFNLFREDSKLALRNAYVYAQKEASDMNTTVRSSLKRWICNTALVAEKTRVPQEGHPRQALHAGGAARTHATEQGGCRLVNAHLH